jgi:hypothetical protein
MIRANVDITIIEGGTYDRTFQWKSGDPAVAVDLMGWSGRMMIRSKLTDTVPLLTAPAATEAWSADGDTGIYIYDSDSEPDDMGKYRIYLNDVDTLGMCATHKNITGVYDLFLTNVSGEVVYQQYGVATIYAASTRD